MSFFFSATILHFSKTRKRTPAIFFCLRVALCYSLCLSLRYARNFFPLYTYFSLALVVMSLCYFLYILKFFILFCEPWNISLQALKQVILSPVSFSKRGVFLNIFLKSYFLSLTFLRWLWLSSCRCFDSLAYLLKEWLSTCVALLFICCFYGSLLPWSFDRLTC